MNTLKNQIRSLVAPYVYALFVCLAALAGPSAFGQNATDGWIGNTSANLSGPNWTGNNPPIAGDNWVFGPAGTAGALLDNTFAGGINVSNIMFNPGASAFTFFDNPITVSHSLTNSSSAVQTFNNNISLTGGATIAAGAGGGDITIGGTLSSSAPFTVVGPGNLTLTNANTGITGSLTNNGTITITGSGGFGAGSAGTYTYAASAFINNGLIVYSSTSTNTFDPKTDGTGGVTVNGPGMYRASPNNSAGWTGPLVINGGIFSDPKPLPANGRSGFGDTTPGNNHTVTINGGIASVDADQAFGQANFGYIHGLYFVVNTNGLLRATTGNSIYSKIFINGGTVLATNGSFYLVDSVTTGGGLPSYLVSSGAGFNFGVNFAAGYQTPFIVNPTPAGSGAGGADLVVNAVLRNSGQNNTATGFTLSGGGTMQLNGANTFTGPISVTQGKLVLADPATLANGDFLGNITVGSGATFQYNTLQAHLFEGSISGAGTLTISNGTLFALGPNATTVGPLTMVISNGATLDVSQDSSPAAIGSTVMGSGAINGTVTTAAGAVFKGGTPGTIGTLSINGGLTMAVGALFDLQLSASAAGPNSQVTVSGILVANGTQVRLTAPSAAQNLDTQNYTLVPAGSITGTISPAPIWTVAPANANHYYITNINNNIVLAYSTVEIPVPGGSSSPANVLRNQNALLVVTAVPASGQSVTSVTVDASTLGGSSTLALAGNGAANTWTNSVQISANQAPGAYLLPATAVDTALTTGHGIVIVNVVASTEQWAGLGGDANFDTAANWAIEAGQTAPYPPALSGDSLTFAGSANLTPVMNQLYSINGLSFASGAGAFNITASGGNILTMAGGNIVNLSTSGETLSLPIVSSLPTPLSVNASNGNLTMVGGLADVNGGLMVNGPVTNTFTLGGPNTFTGPLVLRRGTMALTSALAVTNVLNIADIANSTFSLNIASGGSLQASTNIIVGAATPSSGALSVASGGSLSVPGGQLNLGSGLGSYGYFNQTGGNVGVNNSLRIADLGDHSRFDMSGGTFTLSNNVMRIATGTGQPFAVGEANISGGTFTTMNSEITAGLGGGIFVGENGTGVLNISGNAVVNAWGETNVTLGVNSLINGIFITGLGNGIVNLRGGTLVTAGVTGGTGPSSIFNFNGGSLSNYNGSINYFLSLPPAYFMYNLKAANVYPGGAFIDDGGGNIVINQPLIAPGGFGLNTVNVTAGGANYFAPPTIAITGGSGIGATASAVVSGGKVTAVNVTSPGSGYLTGEKLTFTFTGGGGTGAAATNTALVANASGGLTYSSQNGAGAGSLTLVAPASYTNTTVIKSGTLKLGVGGSISNSAVFALSNNATLDSSLAGGMFMNNQLLKGFGTVSGKLTANSGTMLYPGVDPVIGTLTFSAGGLNMAFGSAATFNLSATSGGSNDKIVINGGTSTLLFANNTIHIKAPDTSTSLDTGTPYVLFQNNSGNNPVGLPNVNPVFDVAPANAGTGHWLIQPSGQNIVLMNSVNSPPGGTATVTVGAVNGTNVVRNTVITLSATISGPNPIQSVSVDLSGFGGSVTPLTLQGGAWTGQLTVPAGTPPGPVGLPIVAFDGTLYGEITLALNVLTTTDTWSGSDFNSNQNTDDNGNWVGSAAPGFIGDSVIFAGNNGLTPNFNHNYTLGNMTFASGAGTFVVKSSGGSVTLTDGVTNNSANPQVLDLPLAINGVPFSGAAGNLVLSNTLTGSGLLNIAPGAGGVTMNGLDAHTGNNSIASGGTLTIGASGTWVDSQNAPSFAGRTTNNGALVFNATQNQTIAGVMSGNGSVTVNGPGELTFSGPNSWTGNLIINGAIVHDSNAQNANAPTVSGLGNPQNGKTNIVNNGGLLLLESAGGNEFGNGSTTPLMKFVVNQGGMIQITAGNATMGPITLNGGTLSIAASASTQFSPYELSSLTVGGTSPSYISATNGFTGTASGVNLTINAAAGAQLPINVASTGSGGPDLLISAVMVNSGNSQNAAGFNKTGNGVMEMSAVNIFTGPITVGAGSVLLDGDGQLATGAYPGNMVISNGASFVFASTQPQINSGNLVGSGTLVVSNTTGPGLTLAGTNNTFTGVAAIKSGTLALAPTASLNFATGVSIGRGATFDLTQLPTPYVWPATSSVIAIGSAASPALIASAGAVIMTNNPFVLTYNDTNSAPQPALNINGSVTMGGNAFTVNTADGLPLANGTYVVVQASGGIASSGVYPAVTGTAIGSGKQGAISVVGSQVILTVSTATVLPPATVSVSRNGSTMTLTWPGDHLGYILQSNSVNIAIPADWFNVPGSSTVTNFPVTLAPGSNVFFRLVSP